MNQNGTKDHNLCGSIFYNNNLICGYGLGMVWILCFYSKDEQNIDIGENK
jgi:hypothetical protein